MKVNENIIKALYEAKGIKPSNAGYTIKLSPTSLRYTDLDKLGKKTLTVKDAKDLINQTKDILKKCPDFKDSILGYFDVGNLDISVFSYYLIDNKEDVIDLMFDLWNNYYNKNGVVQTKSTDVDGRPWEITREFRKVLNKSNVVKEIAEFYKKICDYVKSIKTPIYAYAKYGNDKNAKSTKNEFTYKDAETSSFFVRFDRFCADIVMPWRLCKLHLEIEPGAVSTDSVSIYSSILVMASKPILDELTVYVKSNSVNDAIKFINSKIEEAVETDAKEFETLNDKALEFDDQDSSYIKNAPKFKFDGKNKIIQK